MPRFSLTFLYVMLSWVLWGWLGSPCVALEIPAFQPAKTPKAQMVTLEQDLKKLQKDFDSLKESLEEDSKKKQKAGVASFAGTYFPRIMAYFSEKGNFLKDGFFSFSKLHKAVFLFFAPLFWGEVAEVFLKALVATAVGLGLAYGASYGLKKTLKTFFKWSRKRDLSPFSQFLLSALFVVIPLVVFILSQLTSFFLLEQGAIQRQIIASLSMGGCLLWLIWRLTHLLVHQQKAFPLFARLPRSVMQRFSSSIKGMTVTYVVGLLCMDLAVLFHVEEGGQKIISGFVGIVFLVFAILLLSALRRPVTLALLRSRFLLAQAIASFWWGLASLACTVIYVLWLFDEVSLGRALGPLILTLCLIPICNKLVRFIRKIRLSYLWKRRKSFESTSLYTMLKTNSFFSKLTNFFVYALGVWVFAEVWEIKFLNSIQQTLGTKFLQQGVDVLALILSGYILIYGGDRILRYYLEAKQKESPADGDFALARFKTLFRIVRTLLRIVVWVPMVLIILSMNYDITPILASVGILTAGIAFSVQSFVKDFVTSFFMILENTLVVGDQVEIDEKAGIVEDLSLRTLRVRMDNGILLTIPFSQIGIVGNKSRLFSCVICNISIAYGENVDHIQQLVEKSYQILKKTPSFSKKVLAPLEIRGINEVTDFSMIFQVRLRTMPSQQDIVRRGFNRILKQVFDEANIQVPTPSYSITGRSPSLTNTVI
ncbi:MAG: mechanosensitive ion channel family protein [Alphaproteobacteria bacterium]